jgi:hypothetical protein
MTVSLQDSDYTQHTAATNFQEDQNKSEKQNHLDSREMWKRVKR